MTKYKGTYRTETTRLKNWDYASPGYYFITICTQDHKPFFGQVKDDQMLLSPLGGMAETYWSEIPAHFANATLDEFIIMPNHVHGIVIIQEESVETQHAVSLQKPSTPRKFSSMQPGSLSAIIRSYKSAVTRWARTNGYAEFAWQRRFYDHIIRNDKSLRSTREYIRDNPLKWALDKNNPEKLKSK